MAIKIIGYSGVVADVDGTVYRALRITRRPVNYGLRGSYRLSTVTGTLGIGGTTGSVFQFGWATPTAIALVWGVSTTWCGSAAAVGTVQIRLLFDRNISVYGTGGTLISVPGSTGGSQMLRTSMRPSIAGPVRVATTAALGLGTWTEDPQPLNAFVMAHNGSSVNTNYYPSIRLYGNIARQTDSPLVLTQNEGLNINVTLSTTPSFVMNNTIAWSEVGAY
jgi:hypothetical protein